MVGRIWDGLESVADDPSPDLGPLGGLNAALKYALNRGYIGVLTSGCDTLPVPDNLRNLLGNAPAVIQNHYLFGYWPSTLSMALDTHVRTATNHSMRRWLSVSGALEIMVPRKFYNLNTPEDLDNYQTKS